VKSPIILAFERGLLVSADGGELAAKIRDLIKRDDADRTLCELGLGANHLRRDVRGEFDDKKILGSAHVAVGDNHTIGGANRASMHMDFLATKPELYFDGRKIDLHGV